MAINVKPLGDRVLVQPLEEKEVRSEISSFPTRRKRSLRRGPSLPSALPSSTTMPRRSNSMFTVGDKVLFSKYGGTEIKIDGENYLIMCEDDIWVSAVWPATPRARGNPTKIK